MLSALRKVWRASIRIGCRPSVRWWLVLLLPTIVFLTVSVNVLSIRPTVGLAYSSDFNRVLSQMGLVYVFPKDKLAPAMMNGRYQFAESPDATVWATIAVNCLATPAVLPAAVSAAIATALGGGGNDLDLTIVGLVNIVLAAGGLLLLTRALLKTVTSRLPALILALFVVFVILSPQNLLYFNSLFEEPTSLILLLCFVGAYLLYQDACRDPKMRNGPLFGLTLLLVLGLGLSKHQNLPIAFLTGCALFWFGPKRPFPLYRKALVILAVALPIGIVSVRDARDDYWRVARFSNRFNAVYNGIGLVSTNPENALRALGLPAESVSMLSLRKDRLIWPTQTEKTFFAQPANQEVLDRYSRLRLLRLYLTDGAAFRQVLSRSMAMMSSDAQDFGVSTFLYPIVYRNGVATKVLQDGLRFDYPYFISWSQVRHWVTGTVPFLALVYPLAGLALVLFARVRGNREPILGLLLVLFAYTVSQWWIAVVGDGFTDLYKHLFLARFACDVSLALVAVLGWRRWGMLRGR